MNGMEKSPEIGSGHNTTFFRELDSRTGRWWSVDPVWQPWQSNYSTFDNNPVALSDPSGAAVENPGQATPVASGKGGAWKAVGRGLAIAAKAILNSGGNDNGSGGAVSQPYSNPEATAVAAAQDQTTPIIVKAGEGNKGIPGIAESGKGGNIILWEELKYLGMAWRFPNIVGAIGEFKSGSTNISTIAARFAISIGLDEFVTDAENPEGSQVNAFRHTLWQAMITKKFGRGIAKQAGNAHEENPYILEGVKEEDFDNILFETITDADPYVDLLNNRIGRNIGEIPDSDLSKGLTGTTSNLAMEVWRTFVNDGLWMLEQVTHNGKDYFKIK